jgi:hypothetical protein
MQTKTRYSQPRNRATYSHPVLTRGMNAAQMLNTRPKGYWALFNLAEFYGWMAIRDRDPFGYGDPRVQARREGYKAQSRYFLKLATQARKEARV